METFEHQLPPIPSDRALQIAARCWCDDETGKCVMDEALAKAFAKRIDILLLLNNAYVRALALDSAQESK